jgi:hypothetical protein
MQPNIFLSTLLSNTLTPCSYLNLKPHPGLNILPQHHSVMYLGFAGLVSVAATYALFGLLHRLIHPDVSFPACIKGCYITPKQQVQTCFCAHCDLHVKLIFAHLPTRNSGWIKAHSRFTKMRTLSEPKPRDKQSPPQLHYTVTLQSNAQVWTWPKTPSFTPI